MHHTGVGTCYESIVSSFEIVEFDAGKRICMRADWCVYAPFRART